MEQLLQVKIFFKTTPCLLSCFLDINVVSHVQWLPPKSLHKEKKKINTNVNNSKILLIFFLVFLCTSKILIFLKHFKKYQKYPNR